MPRRGTKGKGKGKGKGKEKRDGKASVRAAGIQGAEEWWENEAEDVVLNAIEPDVGGPAADMPGSPSNVSEASEMEALTRKAIANTAWNNHGTSSTDDPDGILGEGKEALAKSVGLVLQCCFQFLAVYDDEHGYKGIDSASAFALGRDKRDTSQVVKSLGRLVDDRVFGFGWREVHDFAGNAYWVAKVKRESREMRLDDMMGRECGGQTEVPVCLEEMLNKVTDLHTYFLRGERVKDKVDEGD